MTILRFYHRYIVNSSLMQPSTILVLTGLMGPIVGDEVLSHRHI
jgi:hypothetical protein